ncbi:hypothetical protein ACFSUD_19025 [Sulfitobacter aestuarii]|uniref:Capsular biosynthesis protein n=1 Tax=Sulfitobacter aestuarii TaxID=2161676 RepID=A0ABW5U772_9RHOB
MLYRQYDEIRHLVDKVFISLPENFELHHADRQQIENLGIQIIYCESTLNIGEALAQCINTIGVYDCEFLVLYGDTIISGLESFPCDGVSVHASIGEYRWAELKRLFGLRAEEHLKGTLSGLFAFSSVPELLRSIIRAKGDFLEAIRLYDQVHEIAIVDTGQWYDFGHVQTYFQSTGLITTERGFNRLKITAREVVKGSENDRKIRAEAAWFSDIPARLTCFTPAFLGARDINGLSGYATANTYLSTLSHLAVFGDLQADTWVNIFNACSEFLRESRSARAVKSLGIAANEYFGQKTQERLETLARSEHGAQLLGCRRMNGKNLPDISEMLAVTDEIIRDLDHGPECLIHGDFCFSNIFYDFRSASIKVIDPRGELPDGRRSIYGLQSYDIAKLAHSVLGGYDLIIAGYVRGEIRGDTLTMDAPHHDNHRWQRLISAFDASEVAQIHNVRAINAMLMHLFLSMLPLHADRPDRQIAMLGTAYKSFDILTER